VLGTGKTGQGQKQLPGRDEKILDMAGNLLESVLTDKLLATNVRPWLQQLSIPIFKMALNDESIFTDKTHPARQVINAVAQLEFYGTEEGDTGQQAVKQRIDGLLAEVQSADPMTLKVFSRVLHELNVLISVQNKAYEENFQEVLSLSEEEQRQAEASGVSTRPASPAVVEDQALREWKKRVRRLKLGDSLLLDADSKPQRLKLAWISENRNRYIFVNVKGRKELALSKDELALGMQAGSLIVLDDGGDTLLDRAQYSMLQKMHSHLLHETTHDQLTGLINRREFERRLTVALASAHQSGLHHVICYIDLTQFSVVNNTFGYDGGDRLLAEIAELFDSQLGDRGVLARIGGDEFGMLLEDCTPMEALTITSRHKEAMQNYRFTVEDKSLTISFSAGLVSITKESDSIVTVLQAAEASCRVARSKGSNYVQVFSADDTGVFQHMEVLKWVSKIDEALDNDSLDLRHQPIVGIKGGDTIVHHSEILLGVLDDEGKMISPADFVLAAEHFRRMAAVDRWVIERVFQWMEVHSDRLDEIGGLAINLSGSSLNEEGFVDFILGQALNYKVPMHKVCFEITETAGIANLSNASEFILAVKKTGCMFALDDFGSGLSSYAYLKNLPVDFLKIDGMFIKNMDTNPYDFAVVKSITEIGHFMGKEIIAEYVENESILKMLREIGVDYAQGYAIAKPRNLGDF
jgi:diguanylate cyclase (GGDEF)-like protein